MDVLFPMAGQGARFGHQFKPFLRIGDTSFIEAAVRPFRAHAKQIGRFGFVYLEEQEREHDVERQLRMMFADLPIEIVRLSTPTRGPAETIGRAVEARGFNDAALLCDCDHELDVTPIFDLVATGTPYDVILPVWPLEPDNLASWSVAMVDAGRVTAVAEKRLPEGGTGTPMGVIGCYGFADVAGTAADAAAIGATNFSEVIARRVAAGAPVLAVTIHHARFFGDPARLATAASNPR